MDDVTLIFYSEKKRLWWNWPNILQLAKYITTLHTL